VTTRAATTGPSEKAKTLIQSHSWAGTLAGSDRHAKPLGKMAGPGRDSKPGGPSDFVSPTLYPTEAKGPVV